MKKNYALALLLVMGMSFVLLNETLAQSGQLAERLVDEGYNNRNLDIFDDLVASDAVLHVNGVTSDIRGSQPYKMNVQSNEQVAPDFTVEIVHLIEADDYVTARWKWNGTNQNNGNAMETHGVWIARFVDGKVAESWQTFDNASAITQTGGLLMPANALIMKRTATVSSGRGAEAFAFATAVSTHISNAYEGVTVLPYTEFGQDPGKIHWFVFVNDLAQYEQLAYIDLLQDETYQGLIADNDGVLIEDSVRDIIYRAMQ